MTAEEWKARMRLAGYQLRMSFQAKEFDLPKAAPITVTGYHVYGVSGQLLTYCVVREFTFTYSGQTDLFVFWHSGIPVPGLDVAAASIAYLKELDENIPA